MKTKVLVAMSGGVDSSMAAYILKEKGYEVAGATMCLGIPSDDKERNRPSCCSFQAQEEARRVAQQIGIPFYVLDFKKEFFEKVIKYFKREYLEGKTPNPCIICNEKIKFNIFLQKALDLGMDYMATGHYARLDYDHGQKNYILREGLDKQKDQSYVLFTLNQKEMKHLLLPLGEYKKVEIRKWAKKIGLRVHDKLDSQEICFIPHNDYVVFLKEVFSLEEKEGLIKNSRGEILGRHPGYFHYTVGQRRGLGLAYGHPLYVLRVDPRKNELIVGSKKEVKGKKFLVEKINWLENLDGKEKLKAKVKIRSNHPKAEALIKRISSYKAKVKFDKPQEAITPGQAAVFYVGEKVIGGGWIKTAE